MLSRVADSVYWLARQIERAENVARFLDVNHHLSLDTSSLDAQWEPLIQTSGDLDLFRTHYGEVFTEENVIRFLAFDSVNPNSILSCVNRARENARGVREAISSEMWVQVNTFYHDVRNAGGWDGIRESPHAFFNSVKLDSHLFTGVTDTTMSHGEAWHFMRVARNLERADKTTRLMDMKYFILLPQGVDVGSPLDDVQWMAVLKSASALEMYRKKHGPMDPARVVEFLLLDREFPRSVQSCVQTAEESLRSVTGSAPATFRNAAEQEMGRLCSELAYTSTADVLRVGLHEELDRLQARLNRVDDLVHETFFALRSVAGLGRRWKDHV